MERITLAPKLESETLRTIDKSHISEECVVHLLPMKWICVYCNKIMDSTNFADFIRESDNPNAEYHGWKMLV